MPFPSPAYAGAGPAKAGKAEIQKIDCRFCGNDKGIVLELTKQERQIIIFLMATGLLGLGLICYKSLTCPPKIEIVSNPELDREVLSSKIININTATKEELIKLEGIGPALAEKIIRYRETQGRFRHKDELKKVKGIGSAKFEDIKEYIKTE